MTHSASRAILAFAMSLEKTDIEAAIRDAGGNISHAAKKLGVARRTLQNRMRFYGIPKGRLGKKKMRIRYRRPSRLLAIGTGIAAAAVTAVFVSRTSKA